MFTLPIPPNVVHYTLVGDVIQATIDNSKHSLFWHRANGAVYRNNETRVLGWMTTEHAFHVWAAEHFGGDRDADHTRTVLRCGYRGTKAITESVFGAGWQSTCACGHYGTGWQATELAAQARIGGHLAPDPIAAGLIPTQRNAS